MGSMAWTELSKDFNKFHMSPTNIVLHLITTPLMLVSLTILAALQYPAMACVMIHTAWVITVQLIFKMPLGLVLASACVHSVVCFMGITLATSNSIGSVGAIGLFIFNYIGQRNIATRPHTPADSPRRVCCRAASPGNSSTAGARRRGMVCVTPRRQ